MGIEGMSEQLLQVGDEITVARAGAETLENSCATVKEITDDGLVVEADSRLVFIRPGVLMLLRSKTDEALNGWAAVDEVRTVGDTVLLKLTQARWEDSNRGRAPRIEVDNRVIVSFIENGTKETKKTVGQAINLSLTGVRIRVRSALPSSALVHLQLYLSETPCVAIAKVARIVEGSEAAGGGFEVGMSFMRFIQGYDEVVATVGNHPPQTEAADEFGFTEDSVDVVEPIPEPAATTSEAA